MCEDLSRGTLPSSPGPSSQASHPLDEAAAPADPVTLFARWMDDVVAAGLPEPTAMVLATVSPAGRPGPVPYC